jgi:hypothetical protein
LGDDGRRLWEAVQAEYAIADSAGVELLCLACESLDRAAQLSAAVVADGVVIRTARGETREQPALKAELACRAFVAKALDRLGLNVEPAKPNGRPVMGGLGVKRA